MSLATFAGQVFSSFQSTAAIVPSSPFLAQAMVAPLPLARAKTVVELGPGTGVMTRLLLDSLPADASLLAFEVNRSFVDYLNRELRDPRLVVIPRGAEEAGEELLKRGIQRVDAALSSLGLSLMSESLPDRILSGLVPFLDQESVFTQFQYVQQIRFQNGRPAHFDARRLLRRHFRSVERRIVLLNVPPAFVLDCRR
jgi:phospholipid N-methyltransferase